MRSNRVIASMIVASAFLPATSVSAAPDEKGSFTRQVAPILVQKCQGCHGPDKAKGHFRVDTFAALTKPGDGGTAPVTPGDPARSELFLRVTTHDADKRMPQKDDPLTPQQVAAIEQWVRAGAKFDGPDPAAPLASLTPAALRPYPAAPAAYPRPVPVLALAFRPGVNEIAAGGYHEITFWDPAAGQLLRRVGNLPRQIHGLAFSPDGARLAVAAGTPGSAGEVRLFSLAASASSAPSSPPASQLLDRIGDVMLCVAFSPDGARLAAGGTDGAVRVYDVASGKRLLLLEQHADWVTAVAFSPDGTRLASASRDKSARVVDAKTGEAQSAYLGHEAPVFCVAWSGDGARLYSGGRDRELHVWEPGAEGKKVGSAAGFGGDVLRVVAGGDAVFACSADGKLRQYQPDEKTTGLRAVRTYDGVADWAYAVALDASGRVAAGGFDGTVRVFAADGKPVSQFTAAPGYVK